jgi:hypothetical protein
MKNIILTLAAFTLITGSALPAQAGLATSNSPVQEKTQLKKAMDAVAGKCTRLKNCLKGEQACNKSDFAILGAAAIMTYNFTLGIRRALLHDLMSASENNDLDKNGERLLAFLKFTYDNDLLAILPHTAGDNIFTAIFGAPDLPE